MKKIGLVCCVFALLYVHCRRLALEKLDFFEVTTETLVSRSTDDVGAVVLTGTLSNTNGNPIESCGFIWSSDLAAVSAGDFSKTQLLETAAPLTGDGSFRDTFESVRPNTPLYFRAFARDGARTVLAPQTQAFGLGDMVAMTNTEPVKVNNRITVEGRLVGWENLAAKAGKHGHVYSATNDDPKLGRPDCSFTVKDISSSSDDVFTTVLDSLEFNTCYHIRSYVMTASDTFYSTEVKTKCVEDGWLLQSNLPGLHADGIAAVWSGQAFAGLGYNQRGEILEYTSITKNFRGFDPGGNSGEGLWQTVSPFLGDISLANAVSFVIQDTVFVLFGGFYFNNIPGTQGALWKYFPKTDQWQYADPQPPDTLVMGRAGAVAFVLYNKAYVGTGRLYPSSSQSVELNDFLEFDPATGIWRKMESLPVQYKGTNYPDWGRWEAAAFVLDGYGYVGGGMHEGNTGLSDFWRFSPPDAAYPAGRWESIASDFPGVTRWRAVSFSIDNRGFYGLGYHLPDPGDPFGQIGYYLDDLWEYTAADGWHRRESYQGGRRSRALAFGLGENGFVGGGETTDLDSTQTFILESLKTDFWKYVPVKQ